MNTTQIRMPKRTFTSTSHVIAGSTSRSLRTGRKAFPSKFPRRKQMFARPTRGLTAAMVRRIINEGREIKQDVAKATTTIVQATENVAAASVRLLGALSQGLENGNRIGNEITLKKLTFSYIITANSAETNPFEVMVVICKKLAEPNGTTFTSDEYNDLMKDSSTSNTGIYSAADSATSILPYNNDFVKVYSVDRFLLSPPGTQQGGTNFGNLRITRTVDCTKFVPSRIKFDTDSDSSSNSGLIALVIPVNITGVSDMPTMVYTIVTDFTDS